MSAIAPSQAPSHSLAGDLQSSLQHADLRVLLMVLFHMTGDRRWLDAPYKPKRDLWLIAEEGAGFSPEVQHDIRGAALEILSQNSEPVITDPGDDLFVEMMSVCLGEMIPSEYAPMMREQMGFCSSLPTEKLSSASRARDGLPVVVVGAGVSGIAMAAALKNLDVEYTVIEKSDRVAGVWRDNTYPGCGVDTPSHAYSYSFGPIYRWSSFFSPREDIVDYVSQCVSEFGIADNIRLNTEVVAATWQEDKMSWLLQLKTATGIETLEAAALVSAVGQLGKKAMPNIKGVDKFKGKIFHSADWPLDQVHKDQRVGVIGVGASSMQIVPSIADDVKSLSIYQRNPHWARPIPRYHEKISERAHDLFENVPYYAAWFRFTQLWRYGDGLLRSLRKDPDWESPERSLNRSNERHRREMEEYICDKLAGRQDLIEKCIPDYPVYGKRMLLDNGWYDTLLKPHVDLIVDPISHIDEDGIVTGSGERSDLDVIVLATGFDVSELTAGLNITGRDGRKLSDCWANANPTAYLGITVSGFPNLFCLQGPNTGLGHGGSAILQSEDQVHYVSSCLQWMLEEDISAIDVKEQALKEYVMKVDAEHDKLIWTHPSLSSFYNNAEGRVIVVMPWRLVDYWHMTRTVDRSHYLADKK